MELDALAFYLLGNKQTTVWRIIQLTIVLVNNDSIWDASMKAATNALAIGWRVIISDSCSNTPVLHDLIIRRRSRATRAKFLRMLTRSTAAHTMIGWRSTILVGRSTGNEWVGAFCAFARPNERTSA